MNMKVFFDGKIFSSQKQGGISRVGFELMKEFSKRKELEQIFYRGFYVDKYPFRKEWFKKYYGLKRPYFLEKCRLFDLLDNIGSDYFYNKNASTNIIYHSLYYKTPKNPKGPVVVHCHDMIQELFGGSKKTIEFKKNALKKADLIVSISESTKKDLCNLYSDIDQQKIVVIYPGVGNIFRKKHYVSKKEEKQYLLYVGKRDYYYKNFDFLLDVFIKEKLFLDFDLVLFGGEKKLSNIHKEKIKKIPIKRNCVRQEFGDDSYLSDLYSKAKIFIFPSLYEGFGIPPLEAMACECPVLASNTSSIPEVVGDAGLLFDPKNETDFINKLKDILKKDISEELVRKGKERIKKFTWSNMADNIYNEYLKFL